MDCMREAANSIANGIPSRRRQISVTAPTSSIATKCLVRQRGRARRTTSAAAESGRRVTAPARVVRRRPAILPGWSRGFSPSTSAARIDLDHVGAASRTCSQLSNTSSRVRPSNAAAMLSAMLNPGCWVMPRTAATASGTAAGSPTAASSITHTPSGKSSAEPRRRPPAPVVSCRPRRPGQRHQPCALSTVSSSASSASRPMKLVVGGRRLPGVGSTVFSGGKSVRRPGRSDLKHLDRFGDIA